MDCTFCQIVSGEIKVSQVFEDDQSLGFLDHRPIFPGHVLLIPKQHVETLSDLPSKLTSTYFSAAKVLSKAVEVGMKAEGTFVAINNRVSQSVPHLHVHIVPRRKGDGLKGFFWPRTKYKSNDEMIAAQKAIVDAVLSLKGV